MAEGILNPGAENRDPLFDPEWAKHEAEKVFGAQLAAAEQVRDYGLLLIRRLMQTSIRAAEDAVMVCACLRQIVAAFDAWLEDAKLGNTEAASLHLRTLFEIGLSICWIFREGKDEWARRLYVGSVRRKRDWARRLLVGTAEHREFDALWIARTGSSYRITADKRAEALKEETNLTDLLNNPNYKQVNDEFEVARRKYDKPWYSVGPHGVRSIAAMAEHLNRGIDYTAVYSPLSALAHGSDTFDHFGVTPEGFPTIEPIRAPMELGMSCRTAGTTIVEAYRLFIEHYRPGEIEQFNESYANKWRPLLFPPSVTIDEQFVPLGG